jgi:ubiquinone/menaquinone biosynthesis C-methylase UbiE
VKTDEVDFNFTDDAEASAFDELPLWSAPFGLRLLELVRLAPELSVLDLGFGAGFPLLELAQRLGPRAQVHGLDPWPAGRRRTTFKLERLGLANVQLHDGVAEDMPFANDAFDCVVSNNGFNNVEDRQRAFAETARVCRDSAQLLLTLNLDGSFRELHEELFAVLTRNGLRESAGALSAFIGRRRPALGEVMQDVLAAGFVIEEIEPDEFSFRFVSAEAFRQHAFFRRVQLPALKALVPAAARQVVFEQLERRLEAIVQREGELRLTVPFATISAVRA